MEPPPPAPRLAASQIQVPGPQTASSTAPPPGRFTDPGLGTAHSLKHCPPPTRTWIRVPDHRQLQALPPTSQVMDLGLDRGQPQALTPAWQSHRSRFGTTDSLPQCLLAARSQIRVWTMDSLKHCPLPGTVPDPVPDPDSLACCPPPSVCKLTTILLLQSGGPHWGVWPAWMRG
ncbi:hypothetical protein MDA_GLEAN10012978 [Myotis davidii]|uniref:Uncharacterized protein n=1 Tax=Myotis davidii TaxID=225400 RepID=L5LF71_MYODS|nr:hypothetical protein MDA_GLEAN10012978 [Myotis davidii]